MNGKGIHKKRGREIKKRTGNKMLKNILKVMENDKDSIKATKNDMNVKKQGKKLLEQKKKRQNKTKFLFKN